MSYEEHLSWCKDRAVSYCREGKIAEAYTSFLSDMKKHPDTQGHPALALGTALMVHGHLSTAQKMEEFILGFN